MSELTKHSRRAALRLFTTASALAVMPAAAMAAASVGGDAEINRIIKAIGAIKADILRFGLSDPQ